MNSSSTKTRSRFYFWVVSLFVIGLYPSAITYGQSRSGDFKHQTKLYAGDGVRIIVWQDISVDRIGQIDNLNLAGDYLIDGAGNLVIPIVGETRAAGYSAETLAQVIQEKLAIKTIRIVCLPLMRVTVLGAVNRPGSYLIEPRDSLWELVSLAGGPANNADMKKIMVQRGGRIAINNLLEGFEKAHSLEQLGVRSGDQVVMAGISRVTMDDVMRYATFGMSVALLYLQISQYNR